MDISYVKDFADLNHPNPVTPDKNQLYVGWTADGEWCNYTVNVKKAGTYKITALYSNQANKINFSINNKPASECKLPLATGDWHHWNKAEIGADHVAGRAGRAITDVSLQFRQQLCLLRKSRDGESGGPFNTLERTG